jgi:hypothetical protein
LATSGSRGTRVHLIAGLTFFDPSLRRAALVVEGYFPRQIRDDEVDPETPGEDNVVRQEFTDIDVDIYVIVDGDDSYNPNTAPRLISLLLDQRPDMCMRGG